MTLSIAQATADFNSLKLTTLDPAAYGENELFYQSGVSVSYQDSFSTCKKRDNVYFDKAVWNLVQSRVNETDMDISFKFTTTVGNSNSSKFEWGVNGEAGVESGKFSAKIGFSLGGGWEKKYSETKSEEVSYTLKPRKGVYVYQLVVHYRLTTDFWREGVAAWTAPAYELISDTTLTITTNRFFYNDTFVR